MPYVQAAPPASRSLEFCVDQVAQAVASGAQQEFTRRWAVVRISSLMFVAAYQDALTHPTTPSPGADPAVIIASAETFADMLVAKGYLVP